MAITINGGSAVFTYDGTATTTFGVQSWSVDGGQVEQIDTTGSLSTQRTFIPGFKGPQEITIEAHIDDSSATLDTKLTTAAIAAWETGRNNCTARNLAIKIADCGAAGESNPGGVVDLFSLDVHFIGASYSAELDGVIAVTLTFRVA